MDIKSQKNRLSVVELKFARKQAICLRTQYSKMTQIEISHVIGAIPTTIWKCFKKYVTGGEQELKTQKRGSKVSHRKGLSDEDEGKIRCFFVEKMSEQLKFPLHYRHRKRFEHWWNKSFKFNSRSRRFAVI